MNKKYLKIGFIVFFVAFIIFVIIRKISMDEAQTNSLQTKTEEKKEATIDPRTKMKLKDDTSKTNVAIKEEKQEKVFETNEYKDEEKNIVIHKEKTTFKNKDKNELKNIEKQENATILEKEEKQASESKPDTNSNISENTVKKEVVTEKPQTIEKDSNNFSDIPMENLEKKKEETKKNIEEMSSDEIDLNSISDLKNIQSDIIIDNIAPSFTYKNHKFEKGASFGSFTIIDIKSKKIRFKKKNKDLFYSLRFYI